MRTSTNPINSKINDYISKGGGIKGLGWALAQVKILSIFFE